MNGRELLDVEEIISDFDWDLLKGKKILITGATGALARYIVHSLMEIWKRTNDGDAKVIILCRSREKAAKCFGEYLTDSRFVVLEGCVETKIEYEDGIDYIFHGAGYSATKYFSTNPVEIISANTVGTYNLLQLAAEKKVKGFVFFSSCAVNGVLKTDYYTYTGIDPVQSKNCYILGKQIGENMCVSFLEEYQVPAKIVRIGYSYGPYVDMDDGHLYSDFIRSIIRGEDLVIKGDGQKYLGCCYVTDAVRAFFKVLLEGRAGVPYVMRNQIEVKTLEGIAKLLTEEAFPDRKLHYRCEQKPQGETEKFVPIMPKLLMDMGWSPRVSLLDGFRRTVTIIEGNQKK